MAAVVAAMAVACSQDQGAANQVGTAAMTPAQVEASLLADSIRAKRAAGTQGSPKAVGMESFASLPDRGDLVAYPREPVARHAGPYTWHRADISETHALNAIDGVLSLTAPSGAEMRFQYDRHVEHDSGDWTWIGHVVGGGLADDAILTFGAGAVFGTIAQPGKAPLKLTMEDGAAWLVETDLAARAAQSMASGQYKRPDFLLPPDMPVADGLRAADGPVRQASASSAGKTTIDVLIGYTTGFANAQMGSAGIEANITTRLYSLVDATNESYVNSAVSAEIRLVHAMEVAYQDSNDNSTALQALTGSDGSDPVPMDPAFEALHAARDQYGADLVTVVRDFQHPEAVNCGVAWLLGGGQADLHEGYEGFGMSIVSDGEDGGYFCEMTTFAHELGHNMGLAHDVETAKGDDGVLDADEYGRYAYSFGYKAGPASGDFYTVMAYGDSGQVGYRVFSNPDVTVCGGLPCGIEGQTDNAETLRQTVGIISDFRATVVPDAEPVPASDFNGDGRSDILWRHAGNGQDVVWFSGNLSTRQSLASVSDLNWRVAGTGDFNGDGQHDILWRNFGNGRNAIWRSGNAATQQPISGVSDLAWQVVAVGDFDGDGQDDMFWRHAGNGRNTIWRSANATTRMTTLSVTDPAWKVVGAGDFNGDGNDDVLWRHDGSGRNAIWRSGNGATLQPISVVPDAAWKAVGTGDFDGDGVDDIFWRNTRDGRNTVWRSADSALSLATAGVASQAWQVAGVGDFNGDGRDDALWRNDSDGRNAIWLSGNAATQQGIAQVTDLSWTIAGP